MKLTISSGTVAGGCRPLSTRQLGDSFAVTVRYWSVLTAGAYLPENGKRYPGLAAGSESVWQTYLRVVIALRPVEVDELPAVERIEEAAA